MKKMENLLSETESNVWEFPVIVEKDKSITKYDHISVLDDNHGSGNLNDAESFSFTTTNQDIWLLPAESYLKLRVQLQKTDGSDYVWQDLEEKKNEAGVITQQAAKADGISLNDNAFNLFEECRYFVDDKEVERIDYVGMTTLINNLLTYTDDQELESVRHSQLWFIDDDEARQYYVRNICKGRINLLLPLSRIFPFFENVNHVFRGVKHRITFKMNKQHNIIHKLPTTADGKVFINKMEWVVPYLEPSLPMMAKLESQLASKNTFNFKWNAINVYKHQPAKARDIRIPLASTIHKPEKVIVGIQLVRRTTESKSRSMVFDSFNVESCFVEINSMKFPDRLIVNDFTDGNGLEQYNTFLGMCKGNKGTSYINYFERYRLFAIDVSKHKPELYENASFPNICVNLKFVTQPEDDFVVWTIVYNEREASLNLEEKKMRVIR